MFTLDDEEEVDEEEQHASMSNSCTHSNAPCVALHPTRVALSHVSDKGKSMLETRPATSAEGTSGRNARAAAARTARYLADAHVKTFGINAAGDNFFPSATA
jgi:hypothetical protein